MLTLIAITACASTQSAGAPPVDQEAPASSPAGAHADQDLPGLYEAAWAAHIDAHRADHEAAMRAGEIALPSEKIDPESDGSLAAMRFTVEAVGERPPGGWPIYIALHGGGGAPPEVNDSQWAHMQVYYRDSVSAGLYVAPRGVTDTWNLHFVADSYPLYDQLIAALIGAWGANPDRVYLLGFSAGGDGVYQIAPRMADRFAAASMSAGHHNNTDPANLYGVPFLLQVGEADVAYDRHLETARFGAKLDARRADHPAGYAHDTWIHLDGGHNAPWKGNDPDRALYPVLADPAAWLAAHDEGGEGLEAARQTAAVDSNAIAWLDGYTRDPWPERVIWDLQTRAPSRGALDHRRYWLAVSPDDGARGTRLEAALDRDARTIAIDYDGAWLQVLLREELLALDGAVTIAIGDQTLSATPTIDPALLERTLAETGDLRMAYPASIALARDGEAWTIAQ